VALPPTGFLSKTRETMFTVISRKTPARDISQIEVFAPRIASALLPGQYVNVKPTTGSRYVSLPVMKVNHQAGTIGLLVQAVDEATSLMVYNPEIFIFEDMTGPHGRPSLLTECNDSELVKAKFLFIAGGLGVASALMQIEWLNKIGGSADVLLVAPSKSLLLFRDQFEKICRNVFLATDDGSVGFHGSVTQLLGLLPRDQVKGYDLITTFGPLKMMKQVADFALNHGIPATAGFVELLSVSGLSGFRLDVGSESLDAATQGPEFDARQVDFQHAISRSSISVTSGKDAEDAVKVRDISGKSLGEPLSKQA